MVLHLIKDYIRYVQMRKVLGSINLNEELPYLASLDPEQEKEIDHIIHHTLAIQVMKNEANKEYCSWIVDALELRRSLIRKSKK